MLTRRALECILCLTVMLGCQLPDPCLAHADTTVAIDNGWAHGKDAKERVKKIKNPPSTRRVVSSPPTAPPTPAPTKPEPCHTPTGPSSAVRCPGKSAPKGDDPAGPDFTPPTSAEVRVALHLPDPTPRFGPDPSVNQWKMLVVGYPIWLWTDRPTHLNATATHDGLTMTLTADWTSTTFDMGDSHTLTCTHTTIYPEHPDHYGTPSPTCGYTYQKRSKPGHDYTVTATTHWTVDWHAGTHTGTLTTTYTGNRTLTIGELQAIVNG